MGGADEVGGNHFWGVDVVNLLAQNGLQGNFAQVVVDLVAVDLSVQGQVQHRHGNVRGGNADGVTGQLALELRQSLGDGLCGTSLGENHVQGGCAATARTLVEVVDQVLVVGEGVNSLDVTELDAPLVIDDLQHRGDAVGSTGSCRQNVVRFLDDVVVDSVDDVLHIALARRGKKNLGNTLGLKVL